MGSFQVPGPSRAGLRVVFHALSVLSILVALALCGCRSQTEQETVALPEDSGDRPVDTTDELGLTSDRSPNAVPNFSLQDLSGRPVRLSDYAGKAVLLNFWATWCPPCKAELPDLVDIQRTHGGDRFTVIGVSLDQTGMAGVREFVNERGLNYPVLMGNEDVVIQFGNFRGIPTSFLLNTKHELARRYTGLVTLKMVESDLSRLLDEQA